MLCQSKQGLTARVGKWVSDLPSRYGPLDVIEEDDDDDKDDSIFASSEVETIKEHGFDPTMKNLPTQKEVRSKINSLNGIMRSDNKHT